LDGPILDANRSRLHQQLDQPDLTNKKTDLAGASLNARTEVAKAGDEKSEKQPVADRTHSSPQVSEIIPSHEDNDYLDSELPTEEEKRTLRRIGDPLPKAAFLVAIVELCERFTYYGASGIFQNYIQKPLDGSEGRGALGMGHQGATGLSTFFQFWCYGKPSVLKCTSLCKSNKLPSDTNSRSHHC
jgi:POT family proton-dependent oligopeptide transporter